jgi:hypothetical protein
MLFCSSRNWISRSLLAAFILACLSPLTANAQSTQATILGTVLDASGAAVPKATVTVTSTDAGITRTITTDKSGNYQFLDLNPGRYTVHITAPGFEAENETGLTLTARQQLRADGHLQVGAVAQNVEVNAGASGAINTESASIDATLNAIDVQNLPANYRANINGTSPLSLIATLPGVQADTAASNGTGVSFSVQGGLPSQAEPSTASAHRAPPTTNPSATPSPLASPSRKFASTASSTTPSSASLAKSPSSAKAAPTSSTALPSFTIRTPPSTPLPSAASSSPASAATTSAEPSAAPSSSPTSTTATTRPSSSAPMKVFAFPAPKPNRTSFPAP